MSTRTQSVEEYLEAIFKLQRGQDPVTVTRIAAELGVAPPSVSEMLRRLRADGLVAEPAEGAASPSPRTARSRARSSCAAIG